ncbi:MAG: GWxTD domain-containing protein [Bacteroidales bacterium]|nr:GWxTD domain-containing protein [Bacteroidales bacterium]
MLGFLRLIQRRDSSPCAILIFWLLLLLTGKATGCSPLLFQTNNLAETWPGNRWQGPTHVMISADSHDSVVVFIENDPERLPAVRRGPDDVVRTVRLSFGVFTDFKPSEIIDTLSVRFTYPLANPGKKPMEKIKLKAPWGKMYQLWIRPEGQATRFYRIDRSNSQADAEWLLTDEKGNPILNPEDFVIQPFIIQPTELSGNTILIRRLEINACQPAPPFVETEMRCKPSISTVGQLSLNGSKTHPVILPRGGIYLVQADTSREGGKYLSITDEKMLDLITLYALRFITTQEEYSELMEEKTDPWEFWESVAGSTQRAVQLSSAFRKSVVEACKLFSEDLPGALTDRGMIYLVFGPPAIVVTDHTIETWKYLPGETSQTLVFDFDIHRSRLGINHYQLRRKSFYREPWLQAVERRRR